MTLTTGGKRRARAHFNPHEREARDFRRLSAMAVFDDFNPHEREARDARASGRDGPKGEF